MDSEIRVAYLIFLILAYKLGEISAQTTCYECGTMFTPYCEDPIFQRSTLTAIPTACPSLISSKGNFASHVIRYFMMYMTDKTEEMEGVAGLDFRRRRALADSVTFLDKIAPAFNFSEETKSQILDSLPTMQAGNASLAVRRPALQPRSASTPQLREEADEVPAKKTPAKTPPAKKPPAQKLPVPPPAPDGVAGGTNDEYSCYKLVFANMRNELEEFRGCTLISKFDVCELLINFNEKSKERVVFCEVCKTAMTDKSIGPCNRGTDILFSKTTPLIIVSWLVITLCLIAW